MTYGTTRQVEYLYGIPAGTIRRWVHEGRLTRYGPRNRSLYNLEELVDLLNTRANANLSSVGDLSPDTSPATDQVRGSCVNGANDGTH